MQKGKDLRTIQRIHSSRRETSSEHIRIVLMLACLTAFFGDVLPTIAGPIYPPDTIYDGTKPVPSLSRPGYRQTVIDPTFGTRITRISGDEMNPAQSEYLTHHYAKNQPWNLDMTLVKLGSDGAVYLLNTSDWTVFRQWNYHREAKWSTVDPNILFYMKGAQLRKVNVRTLEDTLIHTFPGTTVTMGNYEGNISIGDRYVALQVDGNSRVIVYDIQTDTVISDVNVGDAASDWASCTQTCNFVVMHNNTTTHAVQVRDRNLNLLRTLSIKEEHSDLGYDIAGNEVEVSVCGMKMTRLSNGGTTNFAGHCGHFSTRNYLQSGWATMSTNNTGQLEIFSVKLDGSNIVRRFAHTRTGGTGNSAAKGVVSPDGSKVMWNSDWGSGPVYAYVAEMPGNTGADTAPPSAPAGLQVY